MTQSNFNLPNTDGATFRSNNNTAHQAHATWSSGSTAPGTTYPYQVWIDTANGLLKRRNASNTAWITEGRIDGSNPQTLETAFRSPVATLSDLQAIGTGNLTTGDVRYMRGRTSDNDGGEGVFVLDGSDLSTEVGNDEVTANEGDGGIYVAPASDKTGASGAWVRQMQPFRADFRQASWYGTDGQAILDAISSLGSEGGKVKISSGVWSVNSLITLNNVILEGDGRYSTILKIDSDIDGILIGRKSILRDLRVKGTTAQSNDKTCISLGENNNDTARSAIQNCNIGGSTTFLGDAAREQISADGLRGDIVFLMEFSHVFVTNCGTGYNVHPGVTNATQGINYALHFQDFEVHECKQGMFIGNLKACRGLITTEGNDNYGMIIGGAEGTEFTIYSEGNHLSGASSLAADVWIDPSQLGGAGSGGGLKIGGMFIPSSNSEYGIYVNGQRGFELNHLYFESGYATHDIFIANNSSNWGNIGSAVRVFGSIQNNQPQQVVQANASTGYETNYESRVVTGVAGSGGTALLFTPETGDVYDLYVSLSGATSRDVVWLGIVFKDSGGVVVGDAVRSSNIAIGNNGGSVQLTNNTSTTDDFVFSARRRGRLL